MNECIYEYIYEYMYMYMNINVFYECSSQRPVSNKTSLPLGVNLAPRGELAPRRELGP
jgi:hypothetical protein